MSRRCYTRADVILMLLKACKVEGSQKALAAKAGISDAFLSDVLTGRREPTDRLISIVGMERRTIFVKRCTREGDVLEELCGTSLRR